MGTSDSPSSLNRLRGDYVLHQSHKLRTPLSVLSGYLETISEEERSRSKGSLRKMLLTMRRHVQNMQRIVDDIQVISKLEFAGPTSLRIESFDLESCVHEVLTQLQPLFEKKKPKIKVRLPDIKIAGDRFYWSWGLMHLLEYALQKEGHVPLKLKIQGRRLRKNRLLVKVVCEYEGGESEGTSDPSQEEREEETPDSTRDRLPEQDLGLFIVQRAIEAHGGVMTVVSDSKEKTIFEIAVPLEPEHAAGDSPK